MHHKEESPSRITNDAKNRADLRQKLETCIDPLNDSNYPDKLVNIVTGHVVVHKAVNIENAAAVTRLEWLVPSFANVEEPQETAVIDTLHLQM